MSQYNHERQIEADRLAPPQRETLGHAQRETEGPACRARVAAAAIVKH